MSSDEDKFLSDTEALARSTMRESIWRYRCNEALRVLYTVLSQPDCTYKLDADLAAQLDDWMDAIRRETMKK